MTDQPARVTSADIAAVLRGMVGLTPDTPLADWLAWHECKARLLSQIAASVDTSAAYLAAAEAWHEAGQLARKLYAEGARQ